jgi:hypothetical protein
LGLTAFRLINGISTIKEAFVKDRDSFRQMILDGKVVSNASFQPYVPHRLRRIILKATNVNPDERYQSALEMRRELEKIDLKGGTVTANEHGRVAVVQNGNAYFYEISAGTKSSILFTALKENLSSHRVTKVSTYTCQVKNQNDIKKAAQKFFLSLLS